MGAHWRSLLPQPAWPSRRPSAHPALTDTKAGTEHAQGAKPHLKIRMPHLGCCSGKAAIELLWEHELVHCSEATCGKMLRFGLELQLVGFLTDYVCFHQK